MLIYLDAAESTKEHPNENLGRELLELHTVGARTTTRRTSGAPRGSSPAGRRHVEDLAPVVQRGRPLPGKVKVKGFKDKNRKANGKTATARYLRYLAHHPDTAEHLATSCARSSSARRPRVAGDEAGEGLPRNDTAIVPVLRALVASEQFRHSVDDKVRDPGEDLVATYRALGSTSAAARRRGQLRRRRGRRDALAGRRIGLSRSAGPARTASPSTTSRGPRRAG